MLYYDGEREMGYRLMAISGGLNRLRQGVEQLNPSERRIAEWILNNPTRISSLTVRQLAHFSESSQSAVMRLCKALQFKSYPELKMSIVSDVIRSESVGGMVFSEINPDNPFHAHMEALQRSLVSSIAMTLSAISMELVKTVSDLLSQDPKILAFGSGASGLVAEDIQQKLQRLGCGVWAAHDFHTAAILASHFGPHDIFFAVSYSGRTEEVLEITRLMIGQGVTVIAITKFGPSPLRDLAQVVLPVNADEVTIRVGATASLAASLAIVDGVLLYHVNRYPEKSMRLLQRTRSVVASHRLNG